MTEHLERLREIVTICRGNAYARYAVGCYFDNRHLEALEWAIAQAERVAEVEAIDKDYCRVNMELTEENAELRERVATVQDEERYSQERLTELQADYKAANEELSDALKRLSEAERLIETLREACEAAKDSRPCVTVNGNCATHAYRNPCEQSLLRAALSAVDKWKEGAK